MNYSGARRRFFGSGQQPRSIATQEKFERCPVCSQLVKVGGPTQQGSYVFQPHAPLHQKNPNELCAGTDTLTNASP